LADDTSVIMKNDRDSITLLGMEIDNELKCLNTCHAKTLDKTIKILTFWTRFYLSLQGRINIVKTLVLSQLSYLGRIILPDADTYNELVSRIEKFVKGKLNIGKDRLHLPVERGGAWAIKNR
jgi:hypothetical protein